MDRAALVARLEALSPRLLKEQQRLLGEIDRLMRAQHLQQAGSPRSYELEDIRRELRAVLSLLTAEPTTDRVSARALVQTWQQEDVTAEPERPTTCEWKQALYPDLDSVWETTCGHSFQFNDGGPSQNHAAFCCYCGAALAEILAEPERRAPEGR